jgi:hypothetical protein
MAVKYAEYSRCHLHCPYRLLYFVCCHALSIYSLGYTVRFFCCRASLAVRGCGILPPASRFFISVSRQARLIITSSSLSYLLGAIGRIDELSPAITIDYIGMRDSFCSLRTLKSTLSSPTKILRHFAKNVGLHVRFVASIPFDLYPQACLCRIALGEL